MDSTLCQGTLVEIAASMMSFTVSCSLMEFNKYSLAECSVIDSATFIFLSALQDATASAENLQDLPKVDSKKL